MLPFHCSYHYHMSGVTMTDSHNCWCHGACCHFAKISKCLDQTWHGSMAGPLVTLHLLDVQGNKRVKHQGRWVSQWLYCYVCTVFPRAHLLPPCGENQSSGRALKECMMISRKTSKNLKWKKEAQKYLRVHCQGACRLSCYFPPGGLSSGLHTSPKIAITPSLHCPPTMHPPFSQPSSTNLSFLPCYQPRASHLRERPWLRWSFKELTTNKHAWSLPKSLRRLEKRVSSFSATLSMFLSQLNKKEKTTWAPGMF